MVESILKMFAEFKEAKRADDSLVMTTEDRTMIGLFAVAKAIERLAVAVEKVSPTIHTIASGIEPSFDCSGHMGLLPDPFGDSLRELLGGNQAGAAPSDDEATQVSLSPCSTCVGRDAPLDDEPCNTCKDGSNWAQDPDIILPIS